MQITSTAFKDGEMIPSKYTCDGKDISPPLQWKDVPQNTKSLVLICDDPDAPVGTWDHWVLFNMPADLPGLEEGIKPEKKFPNGAVHGRNSWGRLGYGGPCPPGGTHRYFFKLYALDATLNLQPGAKKRDVENTMRKHVLAQAQLMGKYKRQR